VAPGYYTIGTLTTVLTNITGIAALGKFTVPDDPTNDAITRRVVFTIGAYNGTVTINVAPLSLGYFLGFTDGQTATGQNSTIIATNNYNINFDTYISIWIGEIGTASLDPQQITYKVPITDTTYRSITNYGEGSYYLQNVVYTSRSNRLDRLTITVLDRFGNILNNNGMDWSFTLEIESDT